MTAGAVPVALDGLGGEADQHVEILGDAVQQPAGDVHLVTDGGRAERADLELPLPGHDLGIGARDRQAGVDAGLRVDLDDLAAHDAVGADAAVVRALRGRHPAAGREAERRTVETQHRVFLLESEPHLVVGVLLLDASGGSARVGGMRAHVGGQQHLAHHQDVAATADRVVTLEDRAQHAVGLVAGGLVGGRAVEAPDRRIGDLVVQDLGLAPKQRGRLGAIEPDVFSLVRHEWVLPMNGCMG